MTTLAQEILKRYQELQTSILALVGNTPFPAMGALDPTEIAIMVTTFFSPSYGKDYKPVLRQAMALRGITMAEQELEKIYPLLKRSIDWLIETVRARVG